MRRPILQVCHSLTTLRPEIKALGIVREEVGYSDASALKTAIESSAAAAVMNVKRP